MKWYTRVDRQRLSALRSVCRALLTPPYLWEYFCLFPCLNLEKLGFHSLFFKDFCFWSFFCPMCPWGCLPLLSLLLEHGGARAHLGLTSRVMCEAHGCCPYYRLAHHAPKEVSVSLHCLFDILTHLAGKSCFCGLWHHVDLHFLPSYTMQRLAIPPTHHRHMPFRLSSFLLEYLNLTTF